MYRASMEIVMASYKDMNRRPIIVVALPERSLLNQQLVRALPANCFSCLPLSEPEKEKKKKKSEPTAAYVFRSKI